MLNKKRNAFTITELVIVIAVIAILAAVLIPTFSNVVESANQSAAMQQSKNALTSYLVDNPSEQATGMVFVSNDYAFAYLNSTLQYIGKIGKTTKIFAIIKGDLGTLPEGFEGVTLPSTVSDTVTFTIGTEEATATIDTNKPVYVYNVEVNGKTYAGFFALDKTEASTYQAEGAFYSVKSGYVEVSAGSSITVA